MDQNNVLIHLIFIPTIAATLYGMLWYSSIRNVSVDWSDGLTVKCGKILDLPFSSPTEKNMIVVDSVVLFNSILGVVYIMCEPVIGLVTYTFSMSWIMLVNYLILIDESQGAFGGNLFSYFMYIHIFAWISQFVGHGIYEQRAPALLTNLLFALIAPFFAVLEYMTLLFNYKEAEVKKLAPIVWADIAHYRQQKKIPLPAGIKIKGE
mmetsp:Transcript_32963/g.50420  ORF Transcript_32963/g.50420 Transcript_32963/m.50420 type:complete len:207 (-) Transcript_32963:19-639(-)